MLSLTFAPSFHRPLRVLCIGAHCDDVEIGCGGTLRMLQRRPGGISVDYVVLSGTAERRSEAQAAARRLIEAGSLDGFTWGDFPDGAFPSTYGRIKEFFEELKARVRPDLIFCHERDDRHQDHRIANEMVWTTFRDHLVMEYEIPKWDGELGQPNVFARLSKEDADVKIDALLDCFPSQVHRHWFNRNSLGALMTLRGVECRAESGYAEAFHVRKIDLR